MTGISLRHCTLIFVLAAWPACAQAPGPVSDDAIGAFIDSHAATTVRLEKIARWEDPVCVSIAGLPPGFSKFITQRVRQVGTQVGAPLDTIESCKANVDIVFTAKPQALLDNIRATTPRALGYYDTVSQLDRLALFNRPIQSWYVTQTVDLHGQPLIDNRDNGALSQNVTGNRLTDGLRSAFYHVLIVADPGKLGAFEMGTISDYIALLALSQPLAPEACQDLPSITNMTTAGCHTAAPVAAITGSDTAYLRGLYKTALGETLRQQKTEIAATMKEALAGH